MKRKNVLIGIISIIVIQILTIVVFIKITTGYRMDMVEINRIEHYIKENEYDVNKLSDSFKYDYTVVLKNGEIYQSGKMADTVNEAIIHGDIILDITENSELLGNIIINNNYLDVYRRNVTIIGVITIFFTALDLLIIYLYSLHLKKMIINPFNKLDSFARMIAYGNLDVPLEMDKKNIFGSFTEAFDILRSELKKAREAERIANESKKELIAKLSHDIKTPVASIMAASELQMAMNNNPVFEQIYAKTIQINSLVSNLFDSSLEEIAKLDVKPSDISSSDIYKIIEASDYKKLSNITPIPECLIYADSLRLCQVFDNIISNSYKYANTKIDINSKIVGDYLVFEIEDYGDGCPIDDLSLVLEKYHRGANSSGKTGAGLGLFLARDFLERMNGRLEVSNGNHGFLCKISLHLS